MTRSRAAKKPKLAIKISPKHAIVATLTAVVATMAGANAVSNAARSASPRTALALDRDDAVAIVRDAEAKLASGGPFDRIRLVNDSRRALRSRALYAPAVRLLASAQSTSKNAKQAEDLLLLARKISRRDLQTHIMLNELAVQRNDISAALHHYDTALRTSNAAPPLLYPLLGGALSAAEIRVEFAKIIRENPRWLGDFIGWAVRQGQLSGNVAQAILAAGGIRHLAGRSELESALVKGLSDDQDFTVLTEFFPSVEGANNRMTASVDFSHANMNPRLVPVSWELLAGTDYQSRFDTENSSGPASMDVSMASSGQQLVARKLLFLPTGNYSLEAPITGVSASPESRAQWVLRCATGDGSTTIGATDRVPMVAKAKVAGNFSVPSDCPAQFLYLLLSPGTNNETITVRFASPTIRQIGH